MMRVSDGEVTAPIVGMWHAVFTAHAMNGSPIPDTPIDNALLIFNSDGTEVMNSGRPPQDGNFCLGVWEQTGKSTYSSITSRGPPTTPPMPPLESATRRPAINSWRRSP